jgi:hypothetical protein
MDIGFLITTYNRKESCQRLVDALQGLGDIVVLGDCVDYTIMGCQFHNLSSHYGKAKYWLTVRILWSLRGNHRYYFMLPDDFLPIEGFTETAIRLWDSIEDPRKVCLNLYADRIGRKCWTRLLPVDKGNVWKTGWVDMCFMAEAVFFDLISLRNAPIGNSSGVGAQISKDLVRKEYSLYQAKESLVYPQPEHSNSQMHNEKENISRNSVHTPKGKRTYDTRTLGKRPGR